MILKIPGRGFLKSYRSAKIIKVNPNPNIKNQKSFKWNKNFAYAVGLFTADGCLSSDGRHLEFSSKDKEQVKNFAKCLKLKNSITGKSRGGDKIKRYRRIQFGNVRLYSFFQSIGLTPKKSLTLEKLLIPRKFLPDFLRGLLDGDGSICTYSHPESKNTQIKIRFSSGSYNFLKWLKSAVSLNFNIGGYIEKAKGVWNLVYCKRDGLKILKYLYYNKNLPCLKRKFEKAKFLIEINKNFNEFRWQNRYTCGRSQIGRGASLRS